MPEFFGYMISHIHDSERMIHCIAKTQKQMRRDSRLMRICIMSILVSQFVDKVAQDAKINQLEMRIKELETTNEAEGV